MFLSWKLYSNDELVIDEVYTPLKYNEDEIIITDIYGTHTIDRKNKIWTKVGSDNKFIIDCLKNTFRIMFDDKDFTFDIDTNYKESNEEITITYSYNEDVKKLIIRKKEENEK